MEGGVGTVKPENWEVKGMRKGMTLVELLIVIGIIVVLAGLTFSVILQARRRGQLAACISNLKQLVLAVHAYENDWGMVPIEFHHETSEGVFGRVEQILFPYVRDENLFICPEDPYKGESDIRGGRVVWKGKKWKMSYYYFVNDFTVKEYLGYEMTRPFPDLVLFNCPWHPKVELIARYDGRI
jgi:prepilin-type N-terminal cleavage/methylation domain-containing protein